MAKLKSFAVDLVGLGGVCLVSYGAWLIHQPSGFIVGGLFLIVGCLRISAAKS